MIEIFVITGCRSFMFLRLCISKSSKFFYYGRFLLSIDGFKSPHLSQSIQVYLIRLGRLEGTLLNMRLPSPTISGTETTDANEMVPQIHTTNYIGTTSSCFACGRVTGLTLLFVCLRIALKFG